MEIEVCKSKIHRARVTQADLNYVGSITIDEDLMDASGLHEYEKVQIVNINNGERIETYVIKGERKSGVICLNGAAARRVSVGDLVIIIGYATIDIKDVKTHQPKVVFPDEKTNMIISVDNKIEAFQEAL
ncbi:aspartate 1-decarboxylase [Tenacibaculum sp. 190524A02b]|uniref:Aspartate 1-decarboxylase n=1 Tax=Tenacibaculum vairaonense TaxID=3137860 RepID=A0ABP1FCG7_9FLAO